MKPMIMLVGRMVLIASLGWVAERATPASAQTNVAIRIVELSGTVEILGHGADHWLPAAATAQLYPFDRVLTGTNGSLALLWSDQSVLRFGALTELEILPPETAEADRGLHLIRGLLSFFHRDQPGRIRVITSGALAGIEGTEFVMAAVTNNGVQQTTLSVIDGKVSFSNAAASLVLTNGEQAVAEPGQAPVRTPGFIANNLLQWCFYYPGVLDVNDLSLAPAQQSRLGESLAAYRAGDLLVALAKWTGPPDSDAERVYHAALLLSVGHVEQAEADLSALEQTQVAGTNRRLAAALRTLIAAVKREPNSSRLKPGLATELLAASYYEQSRDGPKALEDALELARRAVTNSPDFGFAWERVAELEFSFGRTEHASAALDQALRLSPRNAEALALKGFLLAAQNHTREAIAWFDRALGVDSALGNAWLGRGLCRIRLGDSPGGREDLLIAAAMEPQRASLRSYLGKAYGDAGETRRAIHELNLAKQMDTNDPTAWLYSALIEEQDNRVNEAIRDLEKSQELNDNRSVYRSDFLLDQDRAVRSANLARIYDEDGMPDVAFREAVRAVNSDYLNYSAHLFLANSYDQLEDPNLVNLRYEPAENTEYLLANLLSPVGAGTLSPAISQQEYSKLFEGDGFHLISSTEYLSRGAWIQSAAQYGTFGNTSYSLESYYRSDPGQRPNNGIQELNESLSLKQQMTPKDSLFAMVGWLDNEGGDLAQRYDQSLADTSFRSKETQDASLILGYHREWQPGMDTLVLAARVPDHTTFGDQNAPTYTSDPLVDMAYPAYLAEQYQSRLTMYVLELQQLIRHDDRHDTIAGVKYAYGSLNVGDAEIVSPYTMPTDYFANIGQIISLQNQSLSIERAGAYLYHRWQVVDGFWLQGGISYDWVRLPEDFLYGPISSQETTRSQISPKAGFVWNPFADTTLRFAYIRSLTGASFEQSLSLEPSQVAGFTQAYRDVVPETAVGGPTPATPYEVFGAALEQKFKTGTYLGISGQVINSTFNRAVGDYALTYDGVSYSLQGPASALEHLDYTEKSLTFTANQIVGRDFSFGVKYQVTRSDLAQQLTVVENPFLPLSNGRTSVNSVLHQVDLSATWNHPSGLFAQFDALWSLQSNSGYSPAEPGDNFWQLNFMTGYRFPRRQAEISVGVLNLTGSNYQLEPLTPYNDLPRSRTLAAQVTFNF